jgi:formylmethanofuran dehydrogenase subunit E
VRSPGLFDDEPVVPSRATIRDTSPGLDIDLRKFEKAERKKRKEERKKRRAESDEEEEERRRRKEAKAKEQEKVVLPGEEGLFDMAYVKKGGTREWDKGK